MREVRILFGEFRTVKMFRQEFHVQETNQNICGKGNEHTWKTKQKNGGQRNITKTYLLENETSFALCFPQFVTNSKHANQIF